jgi:hypothetical protein
MKDLGPLKSCIGIQIEQFTKGIFVHQSSYTKKILEKFSMIDSNPRTNPLDVRNLQDDFYGPCSQGEKLLHEKYPYSSVIGSLSYLANATRPDIAFAVNLLARQTHAPTMRHWSGAKQVMRYLNGTKDFGLFYPSLNCEIIGYADAGYLSEWTSGKSQSGYVLSERHLVGDRRSKSSQLRLLRTPKSLRFTMRHVKSHG